MWRQALRAGRRGAISAAQAVAEASPPARALEQDAHVARPAEGRARPGAPRRRAAERPRPGRRPRAARSSASSAGHSRRRRVGIGGGEQRAARRAREGRHERAGAPRAGPRSRRASGSRSPRRGAARPAGRRPRPSEAQSANSAWTAVRRAVASRPGQPADRGRPPRRCARRSARRAGTSSAARDEAVGRGGGAHQVEVDGRPSPRARAAPRARSSSVVLPAPGGPVAGTAGWAAGARAGELLDIARSGSRAGAHRAAVEQRDPHAALARDLERALVARVRVAHHARARIGGEHALAGARAASGVPSATTTMPAWIE